MSKAYNYTTDEATIFKITIAVLSIIIIITSFITIYIEKNNEEVKPAIKTVFYVCDHCSEPGHIPINSDGEILWP